MRFQGWFKGMRGIEGAMVYQCDNGAPTRRLSPDPSLKLRNHSPTGFEWGYGGSGPSQLALAILLKVTGDKDIATAFYHQFKFDIIASLDKDNWILTSAAIENWLEQNPNYPLAGV